MSLDAFNRLLAPLRRRVDNMIARAVVAVVSDATKIQAVQLAILTDETRENCERFQNYGFTSVPLAGAEAAVLFVGGFREHPLIVAIDDRRWRKKGLTAGESAIYSDEGDYVLLKRGRIVEVVAGTKVTVTTPLVDCSQDHNVDGVYKVDGTQVVGQQGASVTAPVGGGTVDAQARTAVSALISRLQAHGLIG